MMRVFITSVLFDLSAAIEFVALPRSDRGRISRRVSRAATLDISVAVNDKGQTDGDRTFRFVYRPISREHDNAARRIVRYHSRAYVATPEGLFLCNPVSFEDSDEANEFILYSLEKIA